MMLIVISMFVFAGMVKPASAATPGEIPGYVGRSLSENNDYRLGVGDTINIVVYGEEDLSLKDFRLSESGLIAFPFGEVQALGLSLLELETRIADGLRGKYLLNPRVSVIVKEYRPFFINGQVANAGAYPYRPGITVRKAVILAGGFKPRASETSIYVIRESDPQQKQKKIDLEDRVFPGDTITVNESFF
jgi:polysaccharide export outer membrane protein